MLLRMFYCILLLSLLFLFSCSKSGSDVTSPQKETTLQVVVSSPKESHTRYTTSDEIHITVELGKEVVRDTLVTCDDVVTIVNIAGVKAAVGYLVTTWSEDGNGVIVHAPVVDTVTVIEEEITPLKVHLVPRCGSIMAAIDEVPTTVDSLFLSFVSDSGTFVAKEKRAPRVVLSLDNIPFNAMGDLSLLLLRVGGDTVSSWNMPFTYTNKDTTIPVSLINSGTVSVTVNKEEAPVTLITATGDTTKTVSTEVNRKIVISEFCATGGSSGSNKEFVEIWNGDSVVQRFDSLTLECNGKEILLTNVTIPAHGYYVIGSLTDSPVWQCDTLIKFDLVSTSGSLYLRSGEEVLDYLFYFNDYETAGWKRLSSSAKTSWVLIDTSANPQENNYGPRWVTAVTAVDSGGVWLGTPGASGR